MSFVNNISANVFSDNRFLSSQLCNFSENLNIGHFNCQSFLLNRSSTKLNEIRSILQGNYLDVVGVSESWIKPYVSNDVIDMPGYVCHRSDRPEGRGGGVVLYVSSNITHKVVFVGKLYRVVESLFVEIMVGGRKILVGVVYLPNGDVDEFEEHLSDLVVRYSNVVIMGDFNNNLFDMNKSVRLRSICQNMNLSVVHNSVPTHYDAFHNSTSLIDYFLLSSSEFLQFSNQFQCPGISHHSFIFVSLTIANPAPSNELYEYFDYDAIDYNQLQHLCLMCDFSNMYATSNVNVQLDILYANLDELHSIVPVRRRRRAYLMKDNWFKNPKIKYAISLRDLAHTAYVNDPCTENWRIFCRCRNKAKRVARRIKASEHEKLFAGRSVGEMWSILGKYGIGAKNDVIDVDVDALNNIFSSYQSVSNSVSPQISDDGHFSFRSVTLSELVNAFSLIKSRAVGSDGYTLKFLRLIFPFIADHILHLVNTILTTSTFPSLWKTSKIVPIRKNDADDTFRPISIMPILSKMMEHLIKAQIIDHVDESLMLHDCQSGFRKNRSTTSLLIGLTDSIRRVVSDRDRCVLLSLDLEKAFDRLDHKILIEKLSTFYGFSRTACFLMMSYLFGRRQYVCSSGVCSGELSVTNGVPQGSVLGPLLFIMYMNDLFSIISSSNCVPFAFADDIQIMCKSALDFPDVLESVIGYTASILEEWMMLNGLSINTNKTKAMKFGCCQSIDISITLSGNNIEFVDKVKCLGVVLDNNLSFESHAKSIVSKVNFTLRKLYALELSIPLPIRIKIANALIMPIFLYCMEVYSGSLCFVMKKVRLAFNRVVRFVYNINIREHVTSHVNNFLGCTFSQLVQIRNLRHFYKVFKMQTPLYMLNLFEFCRSTRNPQLRIPKLSSVLMRSFHVRVARAYNPLPRSIKTFRLSTSTFRKKLYELSDVLSL